VGTHTYWVALLQKRRPVCAAALPVVLDPIRFNSAVDRRAAAALPGPPMLSICFCRICAVLFVMARMGRQRG
jgi:hypothetical protein